MSIVQRFERNTVGRDFAVGDIHGHFTLLQAALDAAGFDPAAGDRLFSVGDLVDRGPESIQAPEWIARPWFHAVQGNHDDMAIRWPNGHMPADNYRANGGGWNIDQPADDQRRVSAALAGLPVAIEVETAAGLVGIVHAGCPTADWGAFTSMLQSPSAGMRGRAADAAQWDRSRFKDGDESIVEGVVAVVVGHTPTREVRILGNVWHIDTIGWLPEKGGVFTLLNLSEIGVGAV